MEQVIHQFGIFTGNVLYRYSALAGVIVLLYTNDIISSSCTILFLLTFDDFVFVSSRTLFRDVCNAVFKRSVQHGQRRCRRKMNMEGSMDLQTINPTLAPRMQYHAVAWSVYRDKPR